MSVQFVGFKEKGLSKEAILNWVSKLINNKCSFDHDINLVFMNDKDLLELNIKHLNHDYYTDVITFDYSEANKIVGEICISVERVKDNARAFGVSYETELLRVIAHGVLHLLGYKDKTEEETNEMRRLEDLALLEFQNSKVSRETFET